jgi:hypothetical protein
MKKSSKAALLSGLVFPGMGHLFLREYLRGALLVTLSVAALSAVVSRSYEHASLIVDQIARGEVSMEAEAISQAVSRSTTASERLAENAAVAVLAACWVAGIVDSYRLGAAKEGAAD